MYLSGLEIIGFKSFPFKTTVEFANGITGVVGPNGCGKTNVLDAIRWVLGEQRISILRGGQMQDVIFSGTRELKPLGMAEVSLHIVNSHGVLPTEYNNITITRRLYRDGESEYLLNNVVCRLKDITELFADTGMGANAYSAIELDMVEQILSDKADQRRMLFEEAAGITRYKNRKRAAIRKLEATEQDLFRLMDIHAEVRTQANSLSRQMRKAERYKNLEERIKHLGQVLLKERYRRLHVQLEKVREEKRISQIKLAQLAGELDKWELGREDYAGRNLEVSQELRTLRQRVEECSAECHRLETEISVTEERISGADSANRSDASDIDRIAEKLAQLEREKIELSEKIKFSQEELERAQIELEQQEREAAEKLASLEQARKSAENQQRDLFELEGQRSLSDQSRQRINAQLDELERETSAAGERVSEFGREQNVVEAELARIAETLAETRSRQETLTTKIEELTSARQSVEADIDAREKELSEARSDLRGIATEIQMLERMIAHYEGYGSGVSALFAEESGLSGIVDTVANLINTEQRYRLAVETALGDAAEYVVVETREAAEAAIEHLRANDLGRVTFVIADELRKYETGTAATANSSAGQAIAALDVVKTRAGFEKLAALLLGDVRIAASQEIAEAMLQSEQATGRIVTNEGRLFLSRELRSGGGQKSLSLLGREEELQVLRERVQEKERLIVTLESTLVEQREEEARLKVQIDEATYELSTVRQKISQLQVDQTGRQSRYDQLHERIEETRQQIETLESKKAALRADLEKIESDYSRLDADREGKEQALHERESHLQRLENDVTTAGRRLDDARMRVVRLQSEVASLEGNFTRTVELVEEHNQQRENRKGAVEQRQGELRELKEKLAETRERLRERSGQLDEMRNEEGELTKRQGELTEKQSEYEQLLKTTRQSRDELSEENQKLLVSETEIKARLEDVATQLADAFEIDAEQMTMPEPLGDETYHEMEVELADSREKQQQLGMVNMLALEEYEKEAEREEFLRNQIEDLTKAKDDLKATITRINTTARKMFYDTFNEVRTNFQKVFAELFQGGEADIRLEDEGDPLESPIMISARPRGKRFHNISQLSGGEKALTAISLLFAIYLVKPSPFCILDEVDAPLDDANVLRFLRMIRSFVGRTQFILITHNKRTMEQCDRLYGVTMQKPGVSQVVSVDFTNKSRATEVEVLKFISEEADQVQDESVATETKSRISEEDAKAALAASVESAEGADENSDGNADSEEHLASSDGERE